MDKKRKVKKSKLSKVDKAQFGALLENALVTNFPGQSWAGIAREIGLSGQRLYAWTSGKALPNADALPSVLEHFGITLEQYANLPRL
jgi:DNA-binding phage protein